MHILDLLARQQPTLSCEFFPPKTPEDRSRLSDHIRHHDPRGFGIGVAGFPEGHPATPNRIVEMDHLKAKVDAGADYPLNQSDAVLRICERIGLSTRVNTA